MFPMIEVLATQLAKGTVTARMLVERALERIEDPEGEGPRAFLTVAADGARAQADFYDASRKAGRWVPPFAGVPFGVKDLFDLAGEVTRAGSTVLSKAEPAERDAPAIARLKAAGFIVMGRTNMTEFAYSGVGLNPHYGTPRSPWDRANGRIPGGSSSGTAVAVADFMVPVGIGSDTGGSCRIPAAYCGVVGYKPSTGRIPTKGAYPLSRTLDSIGPLARTVSCCAIADAVMADEEPGVLPDRPASTIRLGVPTSYVVDDLDEHVANAFSRALSAMGKAGIASSDIDFPELADIPAFNMKGGLSAVEAYAHHRPQILEFGDDYDQRVRRRILAGGDISAADYLDIHVARARLISRCKTLMTGLDVLVWPTTATVPPMIASVDANDGDYARLNFMSLRNTFAGNFLDLCAISLPMHRPGEPPAGLMVMARHGADHDLLALAQTIETILARA
ncbi:amidase [soil metagenome]